MFNSHYLHEIMSHLSEVRSFGTLSCIQEPHSVLHYTKSLFLRHVAYVIQHHQCWQKGHIYGKTLLSL